MGNYKNQNKIHKLRYKYDLIYQAVTSGLKQSIKDHGPITQEFIPSASKRIVGQLSHLIDNLK